MAKVGVMKGVNEVCLHPRHPEQEKQSHQILCICNKSLQQPAAGYTVL